MQYTVYIYIGRYAIYCIYIGPLNGSKLCCDELWVGDLI